MNNLDIKQLEEKFTNFANFPQGKENVWVFLHSFLQQVTENEDKGIRFTIFRWYVDLTWKRLTLLSEEDFVDVAVKRQIPLAILLGVDVLKEIIGYLSLRCPDDESKTSLFLKAKNVFLESGAYVGSFEGVDYDIKNIIKEVVRYNQKNLTTLEKAAIKEKITKIIFSDKSELFEKIVTISPVEAVDNLFKAVSLFVNTKPSEIVNVINIFEIEEERSISEYSKKEINNDKTHDIKKPEPKQEVKKEIKTEIKPPQQKTAAKATEKAEDPMFFLSKKQNPPKQEEKQVKGMDENITAPKALQKPSIIQTNKKQDMFSANPAAKMLSYKEIRKQVEGRFAKDKSGHFFNITDVINELQKISAAQGDPKIKDLYYFNEQAGIFEWNENLFKD